MCSDQYLNASFLPRRKKKELMEELQCEWQKFKCNLLKLKHQVPQHILQLPKNKNLITQTPSEWVLQQTLSSRSTNQHFMPLLLYIAEVCLSLPVSNAWPERHTSKPGPDSDTKKTRTREKSGLVLGLAFEKPGLDNRKPGLQIEKYLIR